MSTYTKIVGVEVPASAMEGETVNVIVKVKNLVSTGSITIAVTGFYDYVNVLTQPEIKQVGALQTESFPTSFVMLNKNVFIRVGSWYKATDGLFYNDDLAEATVALGTGEPPPTPTKIPWTTLALVGAAAVLGIVLVRR